MSKSIVIFETPDSCFECPHRYEAERMPLGKYTYQKLFRCKKEPEFEDYDKQEAFDPYINTYMMSKGRPDWCTLRVLTDEEFNKLIDILGDVEVIDYDR
jgi:hypothetical protein